MTAMASVHPQMPLSPIPGLSEAEPAIASNYAKQLHTLAYGLVDQLVIKHHITRLGDASKETLHDSLLQ